MREYKSANPVAAKGVTVDQIEANAITANPEIAAANGSA